MPHRVVGPLVLLAACASSPHPAPSPSVAPRPAPPVAIVPIVTCYAGAFTVTRPDGDALGTGRMVGRRTIDPGRREITEEVATRNVDGSPGTFVVHMAVTGRRFTMREDHDQLAGAGEMLAGAPWHWTAWRSTSTAPGGLRVESNDRAVDDGLAADKTVFDAAGKVLVRVREQDHVLACGELAARRAELLATAAPGPA